MNGAIVLKGFSRILVKENHRHSLDQAKLRRGVVKSTAFEQGDVTLPILRHVVGIDVNAAHAERSNG